MGDGNLRPRAQEPPRSAGCASFRTTPGWRANPCLFRLRGTRVQPRCDRRPGLRSMARSGFSRPASGFISQSTPRTFTSGSGDSTAARIVAGVDWPLRTAPGVFAIFPAGHRHLIEEGSGESRERLRFALAAEHPPTRNLGATIAPSTPDTWLLETRGTCPSSSPVRDSCTWPNRSRADRGPPGTRFFLPLSVRSAVRAS